MTAQQWEGPRTEGYRPLYFTTYGNNSFIYTLFRFNEQDLLITDIFSCRGLGIISLLCTTTTTTTSPPVPVKQTRPAVSCGFIFRVYTSRLDLLVWLFSKCETTPLMWEVHVIHFFNLSTRIDLSSHLKKCQGL